MRSNFFPEFMGFLRAARKNPSLFRLAFSGAGLRKAVAIATRRAPDISTAVNSDSRTDVSRELARGIEYVHCAAVPGDIAEFGTRTGETAECLASALSKFSAEYGYSETLHKIAPRTLHLFDSFEGFPNSTDPVDANAPHVVAGVWGAGLASGISPAALRKRCPYPLVSINAGWFEQTLSDLPAGTKFALVHIDCDLYASTKAVLSHLFRNSMLSDGCAVYFDDWYCNRASPDFGEQRAWRECVQAFGVRFTDWGGYATMGRRFIVSITAPSTAPDRESR